MNADSIKIECEEDGFWMVVRTDELEGDIRIRIHDIAEEIYDHVKAAIGPWLYERDVARSMPARAIFACDPDESDGHDASDFYSIHADIWDNREGK